MTCAVGAVLSALTDEDAGYRSQNTPRPKTKKGRSWDSASPSDSEPLGSAFTSHVSLRKCQHDRVKTEAICRLTSKMIPGGVLVQVVIPQNSEKYWEHSQTFEVLLSQVIFFFLQCNNNISPPTNNSNETAAKILSTIELWKLRLERDTKKTGFLKILTVVQGLFKLHLLYQLQKCCQVFKKVIRVH